MLLLMIPTICMKADDGIAVQRIFRGYSLGCSYENRWIFGEVMTSYSNIGSDTMS